MDANSPPGSDDKKRILFVSNLYPPLEIGGYEQLCRDIAERLSSERYVVKILTSDYRVYTRFASDREEQSHENLSISRSLLLMPNPDSKLHYLAQFFTTRWYTESKNLHIFKQMIQEFRPDVVFFWNLQFLPRSLTVTADSMRIPTAYWLAGYSPAEPDEYWQYWNSDGKTLSMRIIKPLIKELGLAIMRAEGKPDRPQMKHVAVVSEYMLRKGLNDGTLPTNAYIIHNGVEYEKFLCPPRQNYHNPITLLQAGTVCHQKGVDVSIEAMRILIAEHSCKELLLLIAGDGPSDYVTYINDLINKYSLHNYVKLLGRLQRNQMPSLMGICDILLLPTIKEEPLARVTQEALASGMIVIASNTGGTPELIIDGETGLLFQLGDIQGFVYQILRAVNDNHLGKLLATNGQKLVKEKFTFERMLGDIDGLLSSAMI
jgi:glycogen(starch) synthase